MQVNGKVRGTVEVALDEDDGSVREKVWQLAGIQRATEGKKIAMEKYVKGRIYTIVAK